MPSASLQTKFVTAEVVNLRHDPKFDERWLEKQIIDKPVFLGLGQITILHSQLIHKEGGPTGFARRRQRQPISIRNRIDAGAVG
jgi:hypothetical protein